MWNARDPASGRARVPRETSKRLPRHDLLKLQVKASDTRSEFLSKGLKVVGGVEPGRRAIQHPICLRTGREGGGGVNQNGAGGESAGDDNGRRKLSTWGAQKKREGANQAKKTRILRTHRCYCEK